MATPPSSSLHHDAATSSPEGVELIASPPSKPPPGTSFSWTPLVILAGTCVGLGMLPALALRRRLVQQGRLLQQIRTGMQEGNARILDLKRASEVSEMVDGIHEKEIEQLLSQVEKLTLARRDAGVLALEREKDLGDLKETIRTTAEQERQRNVCVLHHSRPIRFILTIYYRLLASLGGEMSDAFGRIANFQEEVQLRVQSIVLQMYDHPNSILSLEWHGFPI